MLQLAFYKGGLQWGRDQTITERPIMSTCPDGNEVLQWGRDQTITESAPAPTISTRPTMLQWGRDQTITESTCSSCATAPSIWGFNGAAIKRSRKGVA